MRDYVQHEANSRQAYGRISFLLRIVKNWRMRKTLKQLRQLADEQLRDIGLPREILNQLIELPLNIDMAWERQREALLAARHAVPPALLFSLPRPPISALSPNTSPQNEVFQSPGLCKGMPWRLNLMR